jgi:hypothetical protein
MPSPIKAQAQSTSPPSLSYPAPEAETELLDRGVKVTCMDHQQPVILKSGLQGTKKSFPEDQSRASNQRRAWEGRGKSERLEEGRKEVID